MLCLRANIPRDPLLIIKAATLHLGGYDGRSPGQGPEVPRLMALGWGMFLKISEGWDTNQAKFDTKGRAWEIDNTAEP